MDIVETLKAHQTAFYDAVARIESERDFQRRLGMFTRLRDDCVTLSQAEDDVVYARLERDPKVAGLIVKARRSHAAFLRALDAAAEHIGKSGDDDWRRPLEELVAITRNHIVNEETPIFARMRSLVSPGESDQLSHDLAVAQRLAPKPAPPPLHA